MSVALCRVSVSGAVARILRLIAFRSILFRVSFIVVWIVGPISRPRYLIVSWVLKPFACRSCVSSGVQLTHNIVDLRTRG
jgi:hypothetical protein